MSYSIDHLPALADLEDITIMRQLISAHRALAELKGVCGTIPRQSILINTLALQEAKDSSEIENIITTHDELFRESIFPEHATNAAAKEVQNYIAALHCGYKLLRQDGLLTNRHILAIQEVREKGEWRPWVKYMLTAVEITARDTIKMIELIRKALLDYKHIIRERYSFYSQDLVNHLFAHPYTKIDFLANTLSITRQTAAKYLDELVEAELLQKEKLGKSNYYINKALFAILSKQHNEETN